MKKLGLVLGLGALAMTAACGSGAAATDDTITIGLISPFSGPAASFGPPERASLEYAVERLNDDGGVEVDGQNYEFAVKVYDSAYDPTKAVTVAREALTQDGLKFLEVLGGGVAGAVQPVAEGSNALMFAMGAGSHFISDEHPLTFQPYYNIPASMEACLEVLMDQYPSMGRDILHLYTDDDLGADLLPDSKERAANLGFTVHEKSVARDVTDFASILTGLAKQVDVIDFGPMPPSQYGVAAKQARQLGFKGHFIFPSSIQLEELLKGASAADVEGSVSAPSWDTDESEVGAAWTKHVTDEVGTAQPWTAQNYDNLFLLKAAIEKADSIDPEKVAEVLPTVEVDGVLGRVRYTEKRVYDLDYPVSMLTADGTLKPVD